MKAIGKIALTCLFITCCSCSWFSKKVPDVPQPSLPGAPQVPQVPQLSQPSLNMPNIQVADIARIESSKVAYKKADMTFLINADKQLNRYQNNAHTLFLCLYQLKDPNAFNQLAEDKSGLSKLLECGRFDSSVANAKRVVVQPGQSIKDVRDRAEGVRFIGIASGYFGTGNEKVTYLTPLSIARGDFSDNTISIELGPNEIDKVTVK